MCGICGFFQPSGLDSESEKTLSLMRDSLAHRGPDAAGAWLDPAAGIALGHRRLSILDLSSLGSQPMSSPCGTYVVSFNGEIYNHAELREQLSAAGHRFKGTSDTEVLVTALTEWGLDQTIARSNGMFAIAVWDQRARTLSLIRDRLGEKPLYYGWFGDSFLFGSELKALKCHPAFSNALDHDAISQYLIYNYVPAPRSIYANVSKLPPGCKVTVSQKGDSEPVPYWSLSEGTGTCTALTDDEACSGLEHLLRDAVKRRSIADVPVGAFLSGGIDSSYIVALMQAQRKSPVQTFCVGFEEAGFNEANEAKRVAHLLGTCHTEFYLSAKEAGQILSSLPMLYDEPFSDSSQIPTYLVSRLARKSVKVVLTGDGGDEIFCGYSRFILARTLWRLKSILPPYAGKSLAFMLRTLPERVWDKSLSWLLWMSGILRTPRDLSGLVGKLGYVLCAKDSRDIYLNLVGNWTNRSRESLAFHQPTSTNPESLESFTQWMLRHDLTHYLPDDILVKVDRATMGVGLEARPPFLDHRVVEFAAQLPVRFKLRRGQTKWILRRLLMKVLPSELFDRQKKGFSIPLGSWLRGPLREWAEDFLTPAKLAYTGVFDVRTVRARWKQHLAGDGSWQSFLWSILIFQTWHSTHG